MALSRIERQITWPTSANSITIGDATPGTHVSEVMLFDAADVAAAVQVRCTRTGGSDTTGDTLDVYILWSTGDLDAGGGADDFDTAEHAQFLFRLDNFTTNTPGENPATRTVPISVGAKSFKLLANWNSSSPATRTAVVFARLNTQRAA